MKSTSERTMRGAVGISAKVIGGLTVAIALFAIGILASFVVLGLRDVYAGDTVVEHHSTYTEEHRVEGGAAGALDDADVIEKRTKTEERHVVETVPAVKEHVVEQRTRVESVPAPAIVERRTTVETVPAPAVVEKRTVETHTED